MKDITKRTWPTVKLESVIGWHEYTGWNDKGLLLVHSSSLERAIYHGARYIRHERTGAVQRVGSDSRLYRIRPKYVSPCLACRSLEHRTYSKACPKDITKE